jgi:hypothetical protein
MTLLDTIQEIVFRTVNGLQLTDMAVGEVTSADPLEVRLDVSQAALRGEVIIKVESVPDLVLGDKVLMLSVQHGQKYIILSRLV